MINDELHQLLTWCRPRYRFRNSCKWNHELVINKNNIFWIVVDHGFSLVNIAFMMRILLVNENIAGPWKNCSSIKIWFRCVVYKRHSWRFMLWCWRFGSNIQPSGISSLNFKPLKNRSMPPLNTWSKWVNKR